VTSRTVYPWPCGFFLENQREGKSSNHRKFLAVHNESFPEVHQAAALRVDRETFFYPLLESRPESHIVCKRLCLGLWKASSYVQGIDRWDLPVFQGVDVN